ncbi:MAG: hypothetical protein CMH16_25475 [Methylobacterium sp.]|nr:hypothetical protein [Methylobacterium sp.]
MASPDTMTGLIEAMLDDVPLSAFARLVRSRSMGPTRSGMSSAGASELAPFVRTAASAPPRPVSARARGIARTKFR